MDGSRARARLAIGIAIAVAVLVTTGHLSGVRSIAAPPTPATAPSPAPSLPAAVSARLSLAGWPDRLVFDGTTIWATDYADGLVVRIDPRIGRAVDQILVGQRNAGPLSVAVAGDFVWALSQGRLWRIDRRTDRIAGSSPMRGDILTAAGRTLWVTCCRFGNAGLDTVATRIDSTTGRALAGIRLPFAPGAIAIDGPAIWVAGIEPAGDDLWRIDAVTGRAVVRLRLGTRARPVSVRELAVTRASVWALSADAGADDVENSLIRVDRATNRVAATTSLAGTPVALAADAGDVWVTLLEGAPEQHDVLRIDARTRQISGGLHVASPGPVLLTPGAVWVGSRYLLLKLDSARLAA